MTWALLIAPPALGLIGLIALLRPRTSVSAPLEHAHVQTPIIAIPKAPAPQEAPVK